MTQDRLVFTFVESDVLEAPPNCGLLAVPDFVRQVESWCRGDGRVLVVDLSPTVNFEMSAFHALVWAQRRCRESQRDLVLVLDGSSAFEPHEEASVRSLFRVYDAAERAGAG